MYFLIDYENVHNAGMMGSEYLLATDHIILFYSKDSSTMEQRHLDNIQRSGCGFETYKLSVPRKNGLDFYIATKVGELFGAERCTSAVVVSNDTGFKSVREFWQESSGSKCRVALSDSIEYGIIAASEHSERANHIRSCRKTVDIGNYFAAYQESLKLQKLLRDSFAGTAFVDRLKEIEDILQAGKTPKVMYLDSLKRFGRRDGQEIYRILKTCTGL